jgi:hypothetical protein
MMIRSVMMCAVMMALAACGAPLGGNAFTNQLGVSRLPDDLRAMAAPYQNLETVRLLPDDNCYWYQHRGPVETTLLPLRTTTGRAICASAPTSGA